MYEPREVNTPCVETELSWYFATVTFDFGFKLFLHTLIVLSRLQYLKPVIYIAGFVVLRQFSGGTTIMQFMSHIFRRSHTSVSVEYCVIILGFFQLTFVAISGLTMDRIGRRRCMYISGTIMGTSQLAVGVFEYLHTNPQYTYLTEK